MGIMVFLPDCASTDPEQLIERGAGELLDPGIDAIGLNVVKGPGGKSGMLFTFAPYTDPRSYDEKTQTWLEAPPDGELAKGRYWVGYVTARKPTPEELQRRDLIDGEPVVLADNKVWVIPCCEFAPKRLTRDVNTGEEKRVVAEAHRQWVEWTNALFSLFVSEGFSAIVEKERVVHIPNGLGYAALTLSKNYRVNSDVVDLLGLIEEYQAFEIARVATGMSLVERIADQKKSAGTPSLATSSS